MMSRRTALSTEDLRRIASASVDQHGVRFELEGQILRAFHGEDAALLQGLLDSPHIEELFKVGLVRFRTSEIQVDGYELVVECDRVSVVSYPQEWPTFMLYEAGLMIARLGRALAKVGVGLLDAHPWNVLYEGPRPVWVDLGSLVPLQRVSSAWVDEYRRHIVLPLALRSLRWHSMANSVWADHPGSGIKSVWDKRVVRRVFPIRFARLARTSRQPDDFFEALEAYMHRTRPSDRPGDWSEYVQSPGSTVGDSSTYGPKQRAVDELLAVEATGNVLDVGANAGWFTELAVSRGHRVTSLDTDDRSLCNLYAGASARNQPVLPLNVDAMWPLGSHGLVLSHAAAPDRLRAETTLWLAVVHHLAGRQGYGFDAIARAIDAFTIDRAVVEFIPREDAHIRDWPRANEPWWDVDHFIAAMRPFFTSVSIRASAPDPRLMLCFTREEA